MNIESENIVFRHVVWFLYCGFDNNLCHYHVFIMGAGKRSGPLLFCRMLYLNATDILLKGRIE